jgi:hypothetical protein
MVKDKRPWTRRRFVGRRAHGPEGSPFAQPTGRPLNVLTWPVMARSVGRRSMLVAPKKTGIKRKGCVPLTPASTGVFLTTSLDTPYSLQATLCECGTSFCVEAGGGW